MRNSSPLFVQRSESHASSGYPRDRNMTDSHVWRRPDKNSPAPARPNTAPTDIETKHETLKHKLRYKPGQVLSSVETENNPVPNSSPFGGAVSPLGAPDSRHTPISESMSRRLWQTGVFNGMEKENTSAPDNDQRSERRRVGEVSPQGRRRETRFEKYSGAQFVDKSMMARPDGVPNNPNPEKAKSSRNTAESGAPGDVFRTSSANPPRLRCHALPATRADAHIAEGATPVDRTKIAFMAHIPVYSHQACQTGFPRPANYTEAGTQTEVPPTPQLCQQCRIPSNTLYSPHQREVPREILSRGPLTDGGSPRWPLDERNQAMAQDWRPDDQDELLLRLAAECIRAHPALLEQMALEMHRSGCAEDGEFEQMAPCHRGGHDASALNLIKPTESDTFDDEGRAYPWEREGYPLDNQTGDFETAGDGTGPIYRHVDQKTRSFRPYPIRYRADTAPALQPLARRESVGNPPTLRTSGEESRVYPQDIRYLSEQQPPRCPRPGIKSPIQKNGLPWVHSMAGHTQDENRVNICKPSHFPAHQRQAILDGLEQERAEAYWWSKQLEFPRRYGY